MRKITQLARQAIYSKSNFKLDNTEVEYNQHTNESDLYLHGNHILCMSHTTGEVSFTLAGWNTPTTRERLQAGGVKVSQKKGAPYFQGIEINSNEYYSTLEGDLINRKGEKVGELQEPINEFVRTY